MARQTVLEMVQEILSDMTSDPVNSISDTVEAMQVAVILKRTFLNLVNDRLWPSTKKLFALTSSADSSKPTHMRIEDDITEVDWVKYDARRNISDAPAWRQVIHKEPEEFAFWILTRNASLPNIETVIDYSGRPLFVFNDQAPSFYTSFDDKNLVFDSYDSTLDSILQSSKTQVYGTAEPGWTMADDFVPDMPSKFFPYLVNEAKSTAFIKVKEVFSQKDEQNAQRQKGHLSRNKHRIAHSQKAPNYGRNSPGTSGRYSRRAGYRDGSFTG